MSCNSIAFAAFAALCVFSLAPMGASAGGGSAHIAAISGAARPLTIRTNPVLPHPLLQRFVDPPPHFTTSKRGATRTALGQVTPAPGTTRLLGAPVHPLPTSNGGSGSLGSNFGGGLDGGGCNVSCGAGGGSGNGGFGGGCFNFCGGPGGFGNGSFGGGFGNGDFGRNSNSNGAELPTVLALHSVDSGAASPVMVIDRQRLNGLAGSPDKPTSMQLRR